jgi:four helix bundle protein
MFDFEKLEVYQKTRDLNKQVLALLFEHQKLDGWVRDQWKRATISVATNISEGAGRSTYNDKRNFITMARASSFECVALMDVALDLGHLDKELYAALYSQYETISKMLLGMIRSYAEAKASA